MKTKKPKARYFTANQIRDKIDQYKRRQRALMDSAAALEYRADLLIKHPLTAEDAVFAREQAKKKRRASARIEDKSLVKLKEKLAEFNTETIPGIIPGGDRSVQI